MQTYYIYYNIYIYWLRDGNMLYVHVVMEAFYILSTVLTVYTLVWLVYLK